MDRPPHLDTVVMDRPPHLDTVVMDRPPHLDTVVMDRPPHLDTVVMDRPPHLDTVVMDRPPHLDSGDGQQGHVCRLWRGPGWRYAHVLKLSHSLNEKYKMSGWRYAHVLKLSHSLKEKYKMSGWRYAHVLKLSHSLNEKYKKPGKTILPPTKKAVKITKPGNGAVGHIQVHCNLTTWPGQGHVAKVTLPARMAPSCLNPTTLKTRAIDDDLGRWPPRPGVLLAPSQGCDSQGTHSRVSGPRRQGSHQRICPTKRRYKTARSPAIQNVTFVWRTFMFISPSVVPTSLFNTSPFSPPNSPPPPNTLLPPPFLSLHPPCLPHTTFCCS